jgi:hypothetical protein
LWQLARLLEERQPSTFAEPVPVWWPDGRWRPMLIRRFGQGAGEVRATMKAVIWVYRKCPRQDRVKGGEVDTQVR